MHAPAESEIDADQGALNLLCDRSSLTWVKSASAGMAYGCGMLNETVQHSYGDENDHLEILLHDLIRAIDTWPSDCPRIFEEFQGHLQDQIKTEELLLFPVYERCTTLKSHSPTAKLRSQHRQLRVLLDEIQQKMDAEDWHIDRELTVLKKLLSQHTRDEELQVYSKIDEVLTPRELGALVRPRL